jgi:hypothetical protein
MAERKVVLVRMRPALYEALRRWASEDFRSVNGQIEFLLHEALREAGRLLRRGAAGGAPAPERPRRLGPVVRPAAGQAAREPEERERAETRTGAEATGAEPAPGPVERDEDRHAGGRASGDDEPPSAGPRGGD